MKGKLTAGASISINAPAADVWRAITTPALIKEYLMDTKVISDWKEGSAITYEGTYEGKKYHDKGTIIKIDPGNVFESTYWSSMSGKEDTPENYNTVTYNLSSTGGETTIMITQDNVLTEEEKTQAISNWYSVLLKLKEVVETHKFSLGKSI